jgi:hypothetical protein
MCKTAEDETDEELVQCTSCHHRFHPACLDVNNEMLNIIKTYSWQCIDCKSCAKCNKTHDEVNDIAKKIFFLWIKFSFRRI